MGNPSTREGRMADDTPHGDNEQDNTQDNTQDTAEDKTDWKAEARKWEQRAKDGTAKAKVNEAAAQRLASLEAAQKTDAERAADALAQSEKRAAEAEARVLRRDIALEHKLTATDAALLDNTTDEDAMRSLAARLAVNTDPGNTRTPAPDPNQGRSGTTVASPASQFAAVLNRARGR